MDARRRTVRLYRRDGCHLCDDAERQLALLAPRLNFAIECVDIESDDDLHRRYMFEIPVVAIDGADLLRAPFSARTLEEALTEALRPG